MAQEQENHSDARLVNYREREGKPEWGGGYKAGDKVWWQLMFGDAPATVVAVTEGSLQIEFVNYDEQGEQHRTSLWAAPWTVRPRKEED